MSYSLNVAPSTVTKGDVAVATATVPEVPAEVHHGELIHRGTGEVRAATTLTVEHPQPTIGTEDDSSTDYYVTFGNLEVVQTGPGEFEVRT